MSVGPIVPFNVFHELAFVCQFTDVFSQAPVQSPLVVTVPQLRWTAARSEREATYRFQANNTAVPTGTFAVEVSAARLDYASLEAISVSLPIVPSTPPVPADFLIRLPLWPTRLLTPPAGETVVFGRVVRSAPGQVVAGLRVVLYVGPAAPPNAPYTYTDASGEFVFRLPGLVARVLAGTVTTTETLQIDVTNGGAVTVAPSTFTVTLGQVQFREFTRS